MSEFSLEFVEEYIDTSRRCTRPIELRDALLRHISMLGFDKLSALNIQAVPSVMEGRDDTDTKFIRIGNYPAAWYKRFFETI